jgi:hypothetical protein
VTGVGDGSVAKLIQICASENDLFGLDEHGNAYQYNFNTSMWMALGRRRSAEDDTPSGDSFSSPPARSRARSGDSRASD